MPSGEKGTEGASLAHRSAFVLMPFNDESTVIFDELIVTALEEVGYQVRRADSVIDQRSVLSDIVLGIDGADLIVADLTGLNPNVFYELGIAHGLGIPTVLITQSIEEIPFDLRTYRASEYSTRFDEAAKLREFLREVADQAADGSVNFASPVSDFLRDGPAAKRLAVSHEQTSAAPRGTSPSLPADEVEDEPGTLDLIHGFIQASEQATSVLGHINKETVSVGEKIQGHTTRMQEATTSSAPGSVARAHRIAADVATDLGGYGDILQEELPVLEQASDQMIESGLKWLTAAGADQQAEDLEGFRVALATNYVVIAEALVSTREYRESFHSVRGVTSQLNKSSDRVVSLLGRLLTVMEKTQSFANRGSDIAQEILDADALHVVVEPGLRCFADAAGAEPQPFEAVLLATFDRGVVERALPYLGTKFQKHGLVSWAIDDKEVFPESWFVHPFTGQLEHGWDEAPAFVGGEIELKEES